MSGMLTRGIEFDADPVALAVCAEEMDLRIREMVARHPTATYALALYGALVLDCHRADLGDLDGGFLQEAAERGGLLVSTVVDESCGEICRCADCGDFPQRCLRVRDTVRELMIELLSEVH